MKIATVVGARPQFIKAAAVSLAIGEWPDVSETIIHTGQHFDENMSDVFFDELGIPKPDHTLNIHSLSHGAMTGRMLEAIEQALILEKPDWLIVYGDTNSTIAGALAAAKLQIPIAHIEAGLRSFNRNMPEEINRIATDHISDLLFAPTDEAEQNLKNEGIPTTKVRRTGDVMYDCAIRFGNVARERSSILQRCGLTEKSYILSTLHRAENTDSPALLTEFFSAISEIAELMPVLLPIHPRTLTLTQRLGINPKSIPGLVVIEPLSYLDMIRAEESAALILTDSGGVQKEAYFHRVPCVTIRPQTEWTELLEAGWNRLSPLESGAESLVESVHSALNSQGGNIELYGDGSAARQIISEIRRHDEDA